MLVLAVGQAGGFKSPCQGIWGTGALCAEGWVGAGCQGLSPLQGTLHNHITRHLLPARVPPPRGLHSLCPAGAAHTAPAPAPHNLLPWIQLHLIVPSWLALHPTAPTPTGTAPCNPFLAGTAPRGPIPAGAAPNNPFARDTAPHNPVPGGGCTPQARYPPARHPIALCQLALHLPQLPLHLPQLTVHPKSWHSTPTAGTAPHRAENAPPQLALHPNS